MVWSNLEEIFCLICNSCDGKFLWGLEAWGQVKHKLNQLMGSKRNFWDLGHSAIVMANYNISWPKSAAPHNVWERSSSYFLLPYILSVFLGREIYSDKEGNNYIFQGLAILFIIQEYLLIDKSNESFLSHQSVNQTPSFP